MCQRLRIRLFVVLFAIFISLGAKCLPFDTTPEQATAIMYWGTGDGRYTDTVYIPWSNDYATAWDGYTYTFSFGAEILDYDNGVDWSGAWPSETQIVTGPTSCVPGANTVIFTAEDWHPNPLDLPPWLSFIDDGNLSVPGTVNLVQLTNTATVNPPSGNAPPPKSTTDTALTVTVPVGSAVTLQVTPNISGPKEEYLWSGAPTGATVAGGSCTFTPTSPGTYPITCVYSWDRYDSGWWDWRTNTPYDAYPVPRHSITVTFTVNVIGLVHTTVAHAADNYTFDAIGTPTFTNLGTPDTRTVVGIGETVNLSVAGGGVASVNWSSNNGDNFAAKLQHDTGVSNSIYFKRLRCSSANTVTATVTTSSGDSLQLQETFLVRIPASTQVVKDVGICKPYYDTYIPNASGNLIGTYHAFLLQVLPACVNFAGLPGRENIPLQYNYFPNGESIDNGASLITRVRIVDFSIREGNSVADYCGIEKPRAIGCLNNGSGSIAKIMNWTVPVEYQLDDSTWVQFTTNYHQDNYSNTGSCSVSHNGTSSTVPMASDGPWISR